MLASQQRDLLTRLREAAGQQAAADEEDEATWARFGKEVFALLSAPLPQPSDGIPPLREWLAEEAQGCNEEQVGKVCELVESLPQLAALRKECRGAPNQLGGKKKKLWVRLQEAAAEKLLECIALPRPLALTTPLAFHHWLTELGLTDTQRAAVLGLARNVAELAALKPEDLDSGLPVPPSSYPNQANPPDTPPQLGPPRDGPGADLRHWGVRALLDQERKGVRSADNVALNDYDTKVDGRRFKPQPFGSAAFVRLWLCARGFDDNQVALVQSAAPDLASLIKLDDSELAAIALQPVGAQRRLSSAVCAMQKKLLPRAAICAPPAAAAATAAASTDAATPALNPLQQSRAEQALALVGQAMDTVVTPLLSEMVANRMRVFHARVMVDHPDPDPDDAAGFAPYAILLHQHFENGSSERGAYVEYIPTEPEKRRQYKDLEPWQRTAALFINFDNFVCERMNMWDITALASCIETCRAYTEEEEELGVSTKEQRIAKRAQVLRNQLVHKNVPGVKLDGEAYQQQLDRLQQRSDQGFYDLLDRLEKLLTDLLALEAQHRRPVEVAVSLARSKNACTAVKLELSLVFPAAREKAAEMLRPYRNGLGRTLPARNSLAEALQYAAAADESVLKVMTLEQKDRFDELRKTARPCTRLLEAPAGSGKSLIAVKLVAADLREKQSQPRSAHAPALLLVHTRALQRHVLRELESELGGESAVETVHPHLGLARLQLRHGGPAAYVTTVDALSTELTGKEAQTEEEVASALNAYPGDFPLGQVSLGVVDEGHHVFGHQAEEHLEGQRRFVEAMRVQQVLDACLCREHKLLVFHDDSHQRVGSKSRYPPYISPTATEEKMVLMSPPRLDQQRGFLTRIVRLPGAVRDVSVPFCKDMDRPARDGRVDFYPLLDERVKGELCCIEVSDVSICQTSYGSDDAAYIDYSTRLGRCEAESDAHDVAYARVLATHLDGLAAEIGKRWDLVAVVVPSDVVADWHVRLRDQTASAVSDGNTREALLCSSADGCDEARLFFGPVEHIAGLERQFVVLIGFRHVRRLIARAAAMKRHTRIDASLYQAITRCSYRLVVIEPGADAMVAHHMMRSPQGGAVPYSHDNLAGFSHAGFGTDAFLVTEGNETFVRLTVVKSMDELSRLSEHGIELTTVASLMVRITSASWERAKRAGFGWDKVPMLRALMIRFVEVAEDPGERERLLSELRLTNRTVGQLKVLHLTSNKLVSLPAEIGTLCSLQFLGLANNQLASLPKEIGQLGSLHTLHLTSNKLVSLPAEIGTLRSLDTLLLKSNKLVSLPKEIGQLGSLHTLDLASNKLVMLPAEIGQLRSLETLSFANNLLVSLPAEIGQLGSLQLLRLESNKLVLLPKEIPQLDSLQGLHLDSNQLASLSKEVWQLGSLQRLSLASNKLVSLPAEIEQLGSLQQLNLAGNMLVSLPKEIGTLGSLHTLQLESNQLVSLPAEIGQLGSLQFLSLESNLLVSLPAEIGKLGSLQLLRLESNQLSSLPESLLHLSSLKQFVTDHLCIQRHLRSRRIEQRSRQNRFEDLCRSCSFKADVTGGPAQVRLVLEPAHLGLLFRN